MIGAIDIITVAWRQLEKKDGKASKGSAVPAATVRPPAS